MYKENVSFDAYLYQHYNTLVFFTGLQLILGLEKYNASVSALSVKEKFLTQMDEKRFFLVLSKCIHKALIRLYSFMVDLLNGQLALVNSVQNWILQAYLELC